MRYFFITIFSCLALIFNAQAASNKLEVKKVDFNKIKTETLNPKSKHYFPKLMKSFMSNDTVMSFDDYRYLYYGYVFQEDYSPFRTSEYTSVIEPLYYKTQYTRDEYKKIEDYAELSLNDNIFDLRQMKFYIFALKERQKFARASIRQYRLNHLVGAILSSGNGTKENPWVVTSVDHEYNIINFLGYVATSHTEIGDNIDYITIEKNDNSSKTPEGFYFDISKIMEVANVKYQSANK